MWQALLEEIQRGNNRSLSRAISLVENEAPGYENLLQQLPADNTVKITGITGPPGAGKSTITDLLIGRYIEMKKRVAVICIDPSSPFTHGALLGDRVRMREWYNHKDVYIRSLSTRGTLGGLNPGIIEITDILKAASYDHIIIETVGVGQSEVAIAALADTTVVVQIPEGGDDIQTMKAGLMEIADIFVVNKCDRPGADLFIKNLTATLSTTHPPKKITLIKMIASEQQGAGQLADAIAEHEKLQDTFPEKKISLLTERALQLILKKKIKQVNKQEIASVIRSKYNHPNFNLYQIIDRY